MILHIFNDQKKFSKAFFKMLKEYDFDFDSMKLIHYGKEDCFFKKVGLDTIFIPNFWNPIGFVKVYRYMFAADYTIIHSLASPFILLLLSMFKELGKKAYWVIWGKDLYFYQTLKKKFIHYKLYEFFRKKAFLNIRNIVPIIHEDYVLAKEWYNVDANEIECNSLYPYALDWKDGGKPAIKKSKYNILLGNSASPTNNHFDAINKLATVKSKINKLYCPLSYNGSKKYILKVINHGKKIFGETFFPILDFMNMKDYYNLLNEIDVGFFNYKRQEGLGNIYSLLLQSKTIYLNSNTSTYKFFKRSKIEVFDFMEKDFKLEIFDQKTINNNMAILKELISIDKSISVWKKIMQ